MSGPCCVAADNGPASSPRDVHEADVSIVQRGGRVPIGSAHSSEVTTACHIKTAQKLRVAGLGPIGDPTIP